MAAEALQNSIACSSAQRIEEVQARAERRGLQVVEGNDARNGRYRIQRGRDIVHHADDIEEARGFLDSWADYVC